MTEHTDGSITTRIVRRARHARRAIASRLSHRPRLVRALAGVVVAVSCLTVATVGWLSWDLLAQLPSSDRLRTVGDMAQATTVFDAEGQAAFTIFKEQRIEVPLSQISPYLIRAILAIEDQRFYDHGGVDVVRIGGSLIANLKEGRRAQGGSTITQQLARQSFLTLDKTYRRKFKEVILAAELEARYSKDEILELYLNKVYFGDGLYGAEAASRGYFGKSAADLSVAEAALLAGLVKSPSSWAPTVNLDRALARRAVVLSAMVDAGSLTAEEAQRAGEEGVALKDGLGRSRPHGAYFEEEVRRELVARFGLDRVYAGGLQVYTAYDPRLQRAAEAEVARSLKEIEGRRAFEASESDPLQAALVALDVETGEVRALVGGRSFKDSHFNRAVQAHRQPGSAFKPFVYAAALEAGWTPASIIDRLDEPVQTLQGAWIPEEGHADAEQMTLRAALRTSSNRAAVRLLESVGIDQTVQRARQLGMDEMPAVPSLALGSGEVTLLGMTAAFAAIGARGVYHPPTLIRRVEDRTGKVLYESLAAETRAMSEETAFLLASMLADVVNAGTGWRARQVGFRLPAGGKTGTTNDYVDAWFIGFTPTVATGVWIGFDQPRTIVPGGYAGDLAVPLWGRFMKSATDGAKAEWYTPPRSLVGVEVCRLSGLLPNVGCSDVEVVDNDGESSRRSMVYTDYFPRGKAPAEMCPLHPGDSVLHKLAGLFKKQDELPPVPADQAGVPPPGATPPESQSASAEAHERDQPSADEEKPKKKRGFWKRIFGIGSDDDEDDEKRNRQQDENKDDSSRPRRNRRQ